MLEALKARKEKLHKVESAPAPQPETAKPAPSSSLSNLDAKEEEQVIANHFSVNMDRWVESLMDKGLTITTHSIPLSVVDGQALLAKNKTSEITPEPEHDQILEDIAQRLQSLIDKVDGTSKGCFVKLSCRSPKDTTLSGDRFQRELNTLQEQEREELHNYSTRELILNKKMEWLYRAHTLAMRVHSAQEALDLILQSRRIYWDLTYDLKNPETFSTHLIVREWKNIPLESEFRVFVHEQKITAISQYFTQLYFPSLIDRKDELEQEIIQFWQTIHALLPPTLKTYVIDFAWVVAPDVPKQMIVLELNPFNISTGAALFSWESEHDSDVIEGKLPREFRLQLSPVAHTQLNKVHPDWKTYLVE